MQCFECDGEYEEVRIDYDLDSPYGKLIVPDVGVLICNKCQDECLDNVNSKKIDEAMEKLKKAKQSDDSIMNSSFGWM